MKRKDTHKSGANLKADPSAKGDRVEPLIPDPKALSRAQKTLGPNPPKSAFSKNFEKMFKHYEKHAPKKKPDEFQLSEPYPFDLPWGVR